MSPRPLELSSKCYAADRIRLCLSPVRCSAGRTLPPELPRVAPAMVQNDEEISDQSDHIWSSVSGGQRQRDNIIGLSSLCRKKLPVSVTPFAFREVHENFRSFQPALVQVFVAPIRYTGFRKHSAACRLGHFADRLQKQSEIERLFKDDSGACSPHMGGIAARGRW